VLLGKFASQQVGFFASLILSKFAPLQVCFSMALLLASLLLHKTGSWQINFS
jgi:hypothetical protein